MSTTQTEVAAKLHAEVVERNAWYAFWISNREYHLEANRLIIDAYLTQNVLAVTPDNLEKALEECKGQLAVRDLSHQQVQPVTPEVTATPAAAPAPVEDPNALPAEFTRERILYQLDKEQFKALCVRYSEATVMARVNGTEEK